MMRFSVFLAGFLAVIVLGASTHSVAQNVPAFAPPPIQPAKPAKPVAKSDIPFLLLNNSSKTREKYIQNILQQFRNVAGADLTLTEADFVHAKKVTDATQRARQIQNALKFDFDNSLSLTKAEIDAAIASTTSKYQLKNIRKFWDLDKNSDGIITIKEMSVLKVKPNNSYRYRQAKQLRELMPLAADKSKGLTLFELEDIAIKTFARWDKDGNRTLDEKEIKARSTQQKVARRIRNSSRRGGSSFNRWRTSMSKLAKTCKLPAPVTNNIIMLGASKSGALSSISVAGQDHVTQTTTINIEPGDTPLYVVAASKMPTIWRVTGATERIERFAALPSDRITGGSNAGVIGLDKDQIHFVPVNTCPLFHGKPGSGRMLQARAIFSGILRKPITKVVSQNVISHAALPSGQIIQKTALRFTGTFGNTGGADSKTLRRLYRFYPYGLKHLNIREVISSGKAEPYTVMPGQAGLIQLMNEKKMRRLSDGMYLIEKPIPRFPAGLSGALRAKFMLGKGVPFPAGKQGHSCVISQETGLPIKRPGVRNTCF